MKQTFDIGTSEVEWLDLKPPALWSRDAQCHKDFVVA